MKLEDFDFDLPPELIAKYPLPERHMARLMILNRKDKTIKHDIFWNLPLYLNEGDLLIFNDTKVLPARLYGKKPTGGKVEVLLTDYISQNLWHALVGGKNIKEGLSVSVAEDFHIKILKHISEGKFLVELVAENPIKALYMYGHIPIPPYLERQEEEIDKIYYQTVFAKREGSIAAPTASLHFSNQLLERLEKYGIRRAFITLHVSYGTFKPIKVNDIKAHRVDEEYMEVPQETVDLIKMVKEEGKRVIAVGTTVVRALETKPLSAFCGKTDLYIYPGYTFKVVDAMITNFHLPRSSLLLLVSAFAGREFTLEAYSVAVKERYRFYSYGDGMLIL